MILSRIDFGNIKKRSVAVRGLAFAGMLCLAMLLSGCGFSGSGDQITKIDEKYLTEEESTTPGREAGSEDIQQTEASTETAGEKDGEKSSSQKAGEEAGKETSGKNKAEKTAEKDTPKKNSASRNPTENPAESKASRNAKNNQASRKKPSAEKKNQTSPAPHKKNPGDTSHKEEPEGNKNSVSCYISIDCKNILSHMSELKESKREFVPGDGVILKKTKVTVKPGTSAYDVLYQICREKKIHLEAAYTPMYKTYYVEGIHQLYEFDCGDLSGWNYTVNGVQPSYGCSKYQVKEGDVIALRYTCNRGKDL